MCVKLCLFECDCACPSVSVVVPDECDSAVSCISSFHSHTSVEFVIFFNITSSHLVYSGVNLVHG